MSIQLVDKYECAIPAVLIDPITKVAVKTGETPISVGRMPEAAPILNRYGKHTQHQIVNATPSERVAWGIEGTPNREGTSTHECRSDGVAYTGPVGRQLEDWQCGMDWRDSSISEVMAAFSAIGERPFHPYASGVEYHHVNLLVAPPKIVNPFLPLETGVPGKHRPSAGVFVYILTWRLKNCGYLKSRTSIFNHTVYVAVQNFQGVHHIGKSGYVGQHTWEAVKSAERWCKQHHRKEWSKPI